MKEELDIILPYLEHEEDEILIIRNSILQLDVSKTDSLDDKIEFLSGLIDQEGVINHDLRGYYYLFVACIYYEKREYENVALFLQRANPQLWASQINKALAHWLLGLNYSHMKKYPKAQEELRAALKVFPVIIAHTNSRQSQEQQKLKSIIRERIMDAIVNLNKEEVHDPSPPGRMQNTLNSFNILHKIKDTFTAPSASLPEHTPYEPPTEKQANDAKSKTTSSARPHIVHIIIPVDVNALDNIPCDSACVTPDLVKKIQDFNESRR